MDSFESCPASGDVRMRVFARYGPAKLLERFFLWADDAARERGVELHFATFDDLFAINVANRDSWRSIFPVFHPTMGGVTSRTGFVILGRNAEGDIVATQAARLYSWFETTLREEASSLRMFYADPQEAQERGDYCRLDTPVAERISGQVVFSGAGWYRRDYRGRGLATILPRVSRAFAFTNWNSDFTISMMGDAVVAGGMAARTGYTKVEHNTVDFFLSPMGAMRGAFVWMPAEELLSDLRALAGGPAHTTRERPVEVEAARG